VGPTERTAGGGPAADPGIPSGLPGRAARAELGRSLRTAHPRGVHGGWSPRPGRPDPVELLGRSDPDRVPELVPVRYARMAASPFAFYRGAAAVMADDLAATDVTGLRVQACGDAHLLNFGLFASPERHLVFDVNDFDETLPGPWEWDVKRLAASLAVAAREDGFDDRRTAETVRACVAAYRHQLRVFSGLGVLDLWYAHLDAEASLVGLPLSRDGRLRVERALAQARRRTSRQALDRLTTEVDGQRRIRSEPPTLVRIPLEGFGRQLVDMYDSYAASLDDDRRELLARYRVVDLAVKVVGVGSVGTRCCIVLLEGADPDDVLFLQYKQAGASVLEQYLEASRFDNAGRRVVAGQRLTQAASDIFLGWGVGADGNHYYFRQYRDMKGGFELDTTSPDRGRHLAELGQLCGWSLARAHARTGDAVAIAAYLGKRDRFDRAVVEFAVPYADQNRLDHARLLEAIADGEVPADLRP